VVYENLHEGKQGLAHESSMGNYFKCLFIVQRLSLVQTVGDCYMVTPDHCMILGACPSAGREVELHLFNSNRMGTIQLKLTVADESKSSRCFRGVRSLPLRYDSNTMLGCV
jgi:hypothetical protein